MYGVRTYCDMTYDTWTVSYCDQGGHAHREEKDLYYSVDTPTFRANKALLKSECQLSMPVDMQIFSANKALFGLSTVNVTLPVCTPEGLGRVGKTKTRVTGGWKPLFCLFV